MPVLEARGEPLYLVDRCAPCKGYRGPYFAPLRRIVGRWTPSPSFEDLVCAPFYVLQSSSRGTEPRQGETVPVDMFIISTSKPLLRFSSLDMGPLCPLPLHPSRRYKPIRSEERRARWTSCEEHVQRPQPFHFLGRGEEGGQGLFRYAIMQCATRWCSTLRSRGNWEFRVGYEFESIGK